jgi:hypothetical protein
MSRRQLIFGFTCFLVGILVGIEIAGNLDALVRLVIIVAILLLCLYLALPYLPRAFRRRRTYAPRARQRRAPRRP